MGLASGRDIKRRIRAVQNTKKITKAMEMVAAAQMRKAQVRATSARPYAERLERTLRRLARSGADISHPFLAEPKDGKVVYCVISADRGLAGSFNVNVVRTALASMRDAGAETAVVAVGRKGLEALRRRGAEVAASFTGIGEEARFALAEEIAEVLMNLFLEGRARAVRLVYTEFRSALSQRPREVEILPVRAETGRKEGRAASFIFVPSAEALFRELLPKLVKNQVYQALLESKASEHAARMRAMGAASKNAQELIETYTLQYNRIRQASITKEISEIVGGAEAMKGS